MIEQFKPQLLLAECPCFDKVATVSARPATEGEDIDTVIDGIKETTNTAAAGDYVVTGPKGEEYIISGEKFNKLYEATAEEGVYKAKGLVKAYQIPEGTEDFTFVAPWGEDMLVQAGDYIATSFADNFDAEKCYRIEKGVFEQTYKIRS